MPSVNTPDWYQQIEQQQTVRESQARGANKVYTDSHGRQYVNVDGEWYHYRNGS